MTVGQPELAPIPGVTIREARADEWTGAGEVVARAYVAAGIDPDDQYLAHVRDAADRARTCRVLVAVDDAESTLGCVTYVPGPDSPYAEAERAGDAGIRMLGVDPAARGRGIGSGLVQACIDQARADGRGALVLVTTACSATPSGSISGWASAALGTGMSGSTRDWSCASTSSSCGRAHDGRDPRWRRVARTRGPSTRGHGRPVP